MSTQTYKPHKKGNATPKRHKASIVDIGHDRKFVKFHWINTFLPVFIRSCVNRLTNCKSYQGLS